MSSIFNVQLLLPVAVCVVQLFLIIFLVIIILRKLKLLRVPLGGMEYGEAIFASSVVLATILITISDLAAIFQTYKTLDNRGEGLMRPLLLKAAEFSLVILFLVLLFGLVVFLFSIVIGKANSTTEKPVNENIPFSILLGIATIGMGIGFHVMAKEIIEPFIPRYLNFR